MSVLATVNSPTPLPLGFLLARSLYASFWAVLWLVLFAVWYGWLHESFEFCQSDYLVEVEAECVEDLVEC